MTIYYNKRQCIKINIGVRYRRSLPGRRCRVQPIRPPYQPPRQSWNIYRNSSEPDESASQIKKSV